MPTHSRYDPFAAVAKLVEGTTALQEWDGIDRRGSSRKSVDLSMRLIPLDRESEMEHWVTVKNFSARGVAILHDSPLPYRLVRLTADEEVLQSMGLDDIRIDVVLKWCHFIEAGLYESGGRIARSTAIDIASVA